MKKLIITLFAFIMTITSITALAKDSKEILLGKFNKDLYFLLPDETKVIGENIHFSIKKILYKPYKPWFADVVTVYYIDTYAMRCSDKLITKYKREKYGEDLLEYDYKYYMTNFSKITKNTPEMKAYETLCISEKLL